ncbi:nodT family efflux transporter outer membrane factor (OMF) lipoprotein [Bacteroides sp. CAG:927]|jgi:efflux transporter, outer membrane factor lipoprotein, NodT family|nr:nodT family efflux transporter outer membrane factor (OMF) lipoprotein [Bacteroides sp. CAG:927]
MKNKIIIAALAGIMLSSCGAYKKYQPVTAVDENLYGIESPGLDTTSIANIDWREMFTDKYLQSLIDSALVHNTDYQVAQLRTEQTMASLGAARLAYFPSINLGADGSVSKYDGLTSKTCNIGANASWEVDIFGRLTAAKRGAAAAAVSASERAQAVKTQLVATVATSYYSLMMLDRQIEIADTALANWTESIRVMELLKDAGRANEPGILQAKANKAGLQADIAAMKKSRKEIENSLCAILGMTPCDIVRGSFENISFTDNFSTGLPVQLLANRPDVRAAEMELTRTHYGVGEARASFYPSLTLGGTVGFTNNGGVIVNPGQWLLNAVGQLVQPIFNRGQLRANYKIAEAERKIALLNFNQLLIDAGKEVNNALNDISSARDRLGYVREQTGLLEDAVVKTELLMRHSPTNYLEVLTAQQSLLAAQQLEVQCRYDEIAGIITLYHALGGGR